MVAGIVAAVLTALPVIGFGLVMPARTVEGARQLEHVLGFQEFSIESSRTTSRA